MSSSSPPTILYCQCANAGIIREDVKRAVLNGLKAAGAAFEQTGDLCGLAAARDPLLKRIASGRDIRIAACHERAVRWLFAAGGAPLANEAVKFINMTGGSAEEILRALLADVPPRPPGRPDTPQPAAAAEDQWNPWFPVIDYDRCTGCAQCLNFCLFGVFDQSDEGCVRVANPANCKLNCPACARICPKGAIMFPKYASPPINGGEPPADQPAAEQTQVDLAELLKGDVYAVLRQRGGPTAQDLQRALDEQGRCSCASKTLEKLGALADTTGPAACECDCDCQPPAPGCNQKTPPDCQCDCECAPPNHDPHP